MDQKTQTTSNTTPESDTKEYTRELEKSISSVSDNDTIFSSEKSHMITDIIRDEQTNDNLEDASVYRNSKDLFVKESILKSLTQAVNKKFDDNESSDAFIDTKENVIKYIEDLMMYISKKTNDWSDTIKYRFNHILSLSNKKFAADYLVKHNVLQKMLKTAHTKPDIVEIVFRTIIIVCRNENLISSIGKNAKFATAILTHLKSVHDSVLLCTLKFLKIAVRDIQRDHNSCWLSHLKTCEFFEHCVTTIFKFQFNEALITTATDLLREITEINFQYYQPNLLKQLFHLQHDLIPVLMTSCMQMIISRKNKIIKDKKMDLKFASNWLSIMTIIKTDLITVFRENEERDKYTFLKILFMMLHPYQELDIISARREINLKEQDIDVILKCICFLSSIHKNFYVSLKMDYILMKIILNLKTVAESEAENPDSSVASLRNFSECINESWQYLMKYRTSLQIAESIKQFDQKDREYFLKLAESYPYTQNRMQMIKDKLKETQNK